MKRLLTVASLVAVAFVFVTLIVSPPQANAANEVKYTISATQERNYQEFLQLLETFESPERDQFMSLSVEIREAMLRGDHNTGMEKIRELQKVGERLPAGEQRAISQFLNAHEVWAEPETIESPKGSCSVSCPFGDCDITCDPNQFPWCGCVWGFPRCECREGAPTTTQWGQIILVVLLISSAVYITLRKRRKATMVA